MTARSDVFNFSPGPAHLPDEVLLKAQQELLNWKNSGKSIMEISHRSTEFIKVAEDTTAHLRKILKVPSEYEIIYMQGGARLQFASIPINLLGTNKKCQYIINGHWGQQAANEAALFAKVNQYHLWKHNPAEMLHKKHPEEWEIDNKAAYIHLTSNETVDGIQLPEMKIKSNIAVVADMSSDLLTRPININNFDLIYACAQKNIGPAGITFVIINPKIIQAIDQATPSYLSYQKQIKSKSMLNTPPTFALYMCGLMFEWIDKQGGIQQINLRNKQRTKAIYQIIDRYNDYYINHIPNYFRSSVNITFKMQTKAIENKFISSAEAAGLSSIKGHQAIGGIRISLYNSQKEQATDKIIEFLKKFIKENYKSHSI